MMDLGFIGSTKIGTFMVRVLTCLAHRAQGTKGTLLVLNGWYLSNRMQPNQHHTTTPKN
jgi:hypothetical protein